MGKRARRPAAGSQSNLNALDKCFLDKSDSSVLKGVSKKKRTQRTVKLHLPTKKLCCSLSLSQGQHCRLKKWIGEIRTWLVLQQILDEYFPLIHLIPVPPSCLSRYSRRAKGLPMKIIRQNSVLMVLRSKASPDSQGATCCHTFTAG